jgi:hypothetical protein
MDFNTLAGSQADIRTEVNKMRQPFKLLAHTGVPWLSPDLS